MSSKNTPSEKKDSAPEPSENQQRQNNNDADDQDRLNTTTTVTINTSNNVVANERPTQNPGFTSALVHNIEELERTSSLGVFEHLAAALIHAGSTSNASFATTANRDSMLSPHVNNGQNNRPHFPNEDGGHENNTNNEQGEPITGERQGSEEHHNTNRPPALKRDALNNKSFRNPTLGAGAGNSTSGVQISPSVAYQPTPGSKVTGGQFPSQGSPLLNASFVFATLTQKEHDPSAEAEPLGNSESGNLALHRQQSHLDLGAAAATMVQESVAFAREAIGGYGHLEPMELAMLQAEAGTATSTAQQQITAAELLASIERLNVAEFALLAEATHENMTHGLGSHLMYSGGAWYLPQVSDCKPDEDQTFVSFALQEGLTIALFGNKVVINILSLLMRMAFLVILWCCLYVILPEELMKFHGYVFDPLVCLFVCSVVGGILGRLFGMPSLVFILGMAIMWGNIPEGKPYLTTGIVKQLRSIISKAALSIILVRSGLSVSWKTIKPATGNILSMAFLPQLAEILVHGFLATSIMDYGGDNIWPFLQAVASAPGASAVVGGTALLMRTWGYGITRGPGVLLVPAVVLDMVLGIWAINFMVSLVFRKPDDNVGWLAGSGILQIFGGPVVGLFAGFIWFKILQAMFLEAKVLPHGKYARAFVRSRARNSLFVMVVFCFCLVFGGYKVGAAGGGCLAVVFLGVAASYQMGADGVAPHFAQVKTKQYGYLAQQWELFFMPLLFSVSGSSITVSTMFASDFFGKAIACLVAGIGARIVVAFGCAYTYDMTVSERVICAIVSGGRATVQVALGSLALQTAQALPSGGSAEQLKYANQVYDASILGVIIMTPISVVLLTRVAPRYWLTDAQHAANALREKQEQEEQEMLAKEDATDNEKANNVTTTEANSHNNEPTKVEK